MASGSWKIHSHLMRSLKAVKKAGFCPEKVVVTATGFEVLLRNGDLPSNDNTAPNEWDELYEKRSA